ncbi:hypothetical protein Vau01_119660 [Virgisporangium aurantiacum]|uniref:Phage integrase central domain-containing protein n=1 Tax=Virgisporangium aurantiacum TaxID=175570 RepID=A0A8J4E6U2_9ACTN|nr:hypothetical protein Vau01_119660 [Virgisporangium aurantiacum]
MARGRGSESESSETYRRPAPNRYCARTRYRDYDGKTRDVEAVGPTGPAAMRALKEQLRDRATPNDDEITRETYVSTLANLWIEEITAEEHAQPQTINNYKTNLRTSIVPALGNLRVREATVGRLDTFLREVARTRPAAAKNAKVVLGQMFALAVRRGALSTSPVRETGRIRKPRRTVRALEPEHLEGVRAAIRHWQQPTPGKPTSAHRRPGRHRRPHARHRRPHRRDPGRAVGRHRPRRRTADRHHLRHHRLPQGHGL